MLRADVDTLGRAIRTLDARIAAPVGGHAGRVRGYPTRAERARKQHRRSVLANAPRGRYQLAAPVTFTHRGGQWADRVAANQSVRYDITYCPDRYRWYIDASWSIPTTAVDLASLSGHRLLGST